MEGLGEGQVLKRSSTWVESSSEPPRSPCGEENTRESCGPAAPGQVPGIHFHNPVLSL